MKNKIISIILYSVSLILSLFYIYIEFISNNYYNPLIRILFLFIIVILTYFGALFLTKYDNKYKNSFYRLNLFIWLILYVILLLKMTLFDSLFFRHGFLFVKWNKVVLYDYFYNVVNLIPFYMIIKMIIDFINGESTIINLLTNILGNFIAFMPFAFFLPRLFKKEKQTKKFIITMFIIVSIIELTQFLTLSGTFDVDDYILNIGGAYVMFKILNKEKINKFINNILKLKE